MGGVESAPTPNTSVRKAITREEFDKRVNTFNPLQQEAIGDLSSMLLESDLRQKVIRDPQEMKIAVSHLKETGLGIRDILYVMRYFGLPEPKQNPPMSPTPNM